MTLTQLFTNIANAIRAKTGSSSTIIASNFPTEITNIELGYEKSEGENFNLKNSANAQLTKLNISGNSIQNGTPTTSNIVLIKSSGDAKNLYYLPEAGTLNGITYSINEDRTINLSGTATGAVTFPVFKSIAEAQIENGETYTFSSNQDLPSGVEFRAEAFNNTSWLRHLIGGVINSSVSSRTGTANITNATRIRYLIYIASGTTVNITNLGIQFEKGNTQTSFTPEGKGFINETISNRNLLINEAINQTLNGLTFTVNADKSITVNGTATANTNYTLVGQSGVVTEVLKLNANENYCNTTSIRLVYRLVDGNYGAINPGAFTLSNDLSIRHMYLSIPNGTTYNNEKILPQLIKGTIALEYEPHKEQLFTIPCQQPMRSIGNVRDSFVKIDGVWYEKHNIGQVVLNGSRDWVKSSTYSNEKYFCGYLAYGISNSIVGSFTINDRFQIGHYFNVLDEECMSSMPQLHVRILASRLIENSVNAFKTWLSTHNTEVIYQLAEPIYLECIDEQIEALESIIRAYTYEPITNINSTDEVSPYLDLVYYKKI